MKTQQMLTFIVMSVICLTLARQAFAQQLELFELNDFIDPTELHTDLSGKLIEPSDFWSIRTYAGIVREYQYGNEFKNGNFAFLHAAGRFHGKVPYTDKDIQFSLKPTFLRCRSELPKLPKENDDTLCMKYDDTKRDDIFRNRLQLAFYLNSTNEDEPERSAVRLQFSHNYELFKGCSVHGFSFDFTVSPEPNGYAGFMWAIWRERRKDSFELVFRYPIFHALSDYGFSPSLDIAFGPYPWWVFRSQIHVEYAVPLSFLHPSIHLTYAPHHYKSWNHEISVFMDIPIVEGLW